MFKNTSITLRIVLFAKFISNNQKTIFDQDSHPARECLHFAYKQNPSFSLQMLKI